MFFLMKNYYKCYIYTVSINKPVVSLRPALMITLLTSYLTSAEMNNMYTAQNKFIVQLMNFVITQELYWRGRL